MHWPWWAGKQRPVGNFQEACKSEDLSVTGIRSAKARRSSCAEFHSSLREEGLDGHALPRFSIIRDSEKHFRNTSETLPDIGIGLSRTSIPVVFRRRVQLTPDMRRMEVPVCLQISRND